MNQRPKGPRWRLPPPHWADLITLTGLVLTINEAMFRSGPERPGFQFMFLAMMGLSPAVRLDERRTARKRDRDTSDRQERTDVRDEQARHDRELPPDTTTETRER